MAIVVEDGSGLPTAESYVDRSYFEEVCEKFGFALSGSEPVADVEAALRRGTLAFDAVYGPRFPGVPVNNAQALVFPMTGLVDRRSYLLPEFPVQVKQAAAVMSWSELTSPMSLWPTVTPGKVKKSVTAGPVSVEWDLTGGSLGSVGAARPILSIVEGILASIAVLPVAGARALYGSAVRG